MPKRKIIITRSDYEYLKELLSSEFTQAISPSDYLESLEAELELAEVVDPERVPKHVVTMNSTVKLRDLDTFVIVAECGSMAKARGSCGLARAPSRARRDLASSWCRR